MKKAAKKGFGMGWALIFYALVCFFSSSAVASSMNIAAGILEKNHGWNAALLTSMISLCSVANIVAGFVFGRLVVKRSAKKLSIVALVAYIVSLLLLGSAKNLIVFGIFMILAGGLSNGIGYQIAPVMISRWFPRRKGVVMGIVTIGIPLCNGFATMIYSAGYRIGGEFGGFAIYIPFALVSLLVLLFFLSDNPRDRGYLPDNGAGVEEAEEKPAAEKGKSIWTTRKLLATPQVWIHGITLGIQLLFAGGLMVQLYPRLVEIGFDDGTAQLMMMASGLLAVPCSYLCGLMDAKIGARKAACSSYICGILAMILNLTGNTVCVWLSLVCIGMVVGGAANWPASLCIEEFGDSFAEGYGIIQPMIQVVGAVGPVFFASIFSISGSYRASYICGAVLMAVGLVAYLVLAKAGFVKTEEEKAAKRTAGHRA